ncbi:uncharacterized protein LOC111488192 [Cucurbita maxima]|uniref:Uncharacterized protein LOC111488192 n=1 Tax=Cucurbita maxima TaxID=3661 RepID=A0A6J1JWV4_CUCMA|nr:uncharacterized protein LOC111488192 [Cucurbita maxima]
MATDLAIFHPTPIRASSFGKSEPNRRKATAPKWWSPIFGWSSEPDYVDSSSAEQPVQNANPKLDSGRAKSRFSLGCFTEEKAKNALNENAGELPFHDIMYHSAIASHLASNLSDRSKK